MDLNMKSLRKYPLSVIPFLLWAYTLGFFLHHCQSPFCGEISRQECWLSSHMLHALSPGREEWQMCYVCQNSLESLAGMSLKT